MLINILEIQLSSAQTCGPCTCSPWASNGQTATTNVWINSGVVCSARTCDEACSNLWYSANCAC